MQHSNGKVCLETSPDGHLPSPKTGPTPLPGAAISLPLPAFTRCPGELILLGKKMFISSLDQLPAPAPCNAHKWLWQ